MTPKKSPTLPTSVWMQSFGRMEKRISSDCSLVNPCHESLYGGIIGYRDTVLVAQAKSLVHKVWSTMGLLLLLGAGPSVAKNSPSVAANLFRG